MIGPNFGKNTAQILRDSYKSTNMPQCIDTSWRKQHGPWLFKELIHPGTKMQTGRKNVAYDNGYVYEKNI